MKLGLINRDAFPALRPEAKPLTWVSDSTTAGCRLRFGNASALSVAHVEEDRPSPQSALPLHGYGRMETDSPGLFPVATGTTRSGRQGFALHWALGSATCLSSDSVTGVKFGPPEAAGGFYRPGATARASHQLFHLVLWSHK